ncbi:MAG: RNA-directed DNA polymerase, partial [Verrucomicrobiae bacterium]|nr:RNA-directed DNA polymerase [Verrucomicrobiae bacterium]
MSPIAKAARKLAQVLLAGPLTMVAAKARMRHALGRCPRWLTPVLKEAVARVGEGTRPRLMRMARLLQFNPAFARAVVEGRVHFIGEPFAAKMCPAAGVPETWQLPALASPAELARWLNVTPGELEWFADIQLRNARESSPRLGHYHYRWQSKRDGGARLIESPKLRLKLLQRQVLREILDRILPHEAAHGFRAGRSICSFIAPHVARPIVMRLDLRDFFPSITRARIVALFLTAGYP